MPRPSPARRALTWWFAPPYNPWVAVSFAVDTTTTRAWLQGLRERGLRISLNTLTAATIARALRAWPKANGRVVGGRIVLEEHVGMAMPVNLMDAGAEDSEVSITVVTRVDTMTLAELAEATRGKVHAERRGERSHPLTNLMWKVAERAPDRLFDASLRLMDRAVNHPIAGPPIYRQLGVTSGLSNVGAAMGGLDGMLFRAVSVAPPQRLFQVGTFWGTSVVQDEVVAVAGRPEVRPMLPAMLLFDHRLIDGVMAGRLAATFGEMLRDPERVFGAAGDKAP